MRAPLAALCLLRALWALIVPETPRPPPPAPETPRPPPPTQIGRFPLPARLVGGRRFPPIPP